MWVRDGGGWEKLGRYQKLGGGEDSTNTDQGDKGGQVFLCDLKMQSQALAFLSDSNRALAPTWAS